MSRRGRVVRAFRWAIVNFLFAAAVYYGFAEDVGGARNVATFCIWSTFVLSMFTGMDSVRNAMRAKGPSVAPWIDGLLDTVVAVFLLWHGEMLLATIYVIHTLLIHAVYAKPQSKEE